MKEKRETPMSPSLMIAIGFALLILLVTLPVSYTHLTLPTILRV